MLQSDLKKQKTPLMKKMKGLQAPHGATSVFMEPSSKVLTFNDVESDLEPSL